MPIILIYDKDENIRFPFPYWRQRAGQFLPHFPYEFRRVTFLRATNPVELYDMAYRFRQELAIIYIPYANIFFESKSSPDDGLLRLVNECIRLKLLIIGMDPGQVWLPRQSLGNISLLVYSSRSYRVQSIFEKLLEGSSLLDIYEDGRAPSGDVLIDRLIGRPDDTNIYVEYSENVLFCNNFINLSWYLVDASDSSDGEIRPSLILPNANFDFKSYRYNFQFDLRSTNFEEYISLYWTRALFVYIRSRGLSFEKLPGFHSVSVGYIDSIGRSKSTSNYPPRSFLRRRRITDEYQELMDFTPEMGDFNRKFGVIINIEGFPDEPNQIYYARVDWFIFPFQFRFIEVEYHHEIFSHPNGGQCAGMVRLGNKQGFLTARHVIGHVGNSFQMSCGHQGSVIASGEGNIDAAVYTCDCGCKVSQPSEELIPIERIAPWTDISFYDSNSRLIRGKVRSVMDTQGILDSPFIPSILFLSVYGQPGDSGALVSEDQNEGSPVGIYMGAYTDPSGYRGGLAQHAFQAANIMGFKLYR